MRGKQEEREGKGGRGKGKGREAKKEEWGGGERTGEIENKRSLVEKVKEKYNVLIYSDGMTISCPWKAQSVSSLRSRFHHCNKMEPV